MLLVKHVLQATALHVFRIVMIRFAILDHGLRQIVGLHVQTIVTFLQIYVLAPSVCATLPIVLVKTAGIVMVVAVYARGPVFRVIALQEHANRSSDL